MQWGRNVSWFRKNGSENFSILHADIYKISITARPLFPVPLSRNIFTTALVEYMGYGSASTRAVTIWPICALIITHKNFTVYYNVEILIHQHVDWVHWNTDQQFEQPSWQHVVIGINVLGGHYLKYLTMHTGREKIRKALISADCCSWSHFYSAT